MGVHLVTGYAGKAHITSADQGAFNAGCVGIGDYVLPIGDMFEASISTGDLAYVLVNGGHLCMQGRHISMDAREDISFSTPSNIYERTDLIVMRYSKDTNTGVETAELAVKTGIAVAVGSAMVDPEYTTGDILNGALVHEMPLYRVFIQHMRIKRIDRLFTVIPALAGLVNMRNMLINGDFQCNQRGNKTYDGGNSAVYSVDMWRAYKVKVDVLNEGITLTGTSTSEQGYFTQFIQLGKLKTTPYTISAMADGKICTFTVTPGANAKEKDFGTFKISALTTSTWDNDLNDYNNKLKINICPIGTNSITLTYVDVFEGSIPYPHVKEDPATALMRCRRYVQHWVGTCPIVYRYTGDATGQYKYRFRISFDSMANPNNAIFKGGSWSYFDINGESQTGYYDALEIVSRGNGFIEVKTDSVKSLADGATGMRVTYILTCEPTDS